MKKITMMCALIMMIMATTAFSQSIREYRAAHAKLLAKQTTVKDKIRIPEAEITAKTLYGDEDAALFNYGWNSGRVNAYEGVDIPQTKNIKITNYVMPTKHRTVNSHYGYRKQFGRMHKGVDLKAQTGDTIYAVFTGKVRITKFDRDGYGFYIVMRHMNGLETVYGHLSKFLVKPNQFVTVGTPIALSGNTGRSTGPHLHFETRYMGIALNPEKIFDFTKGAALNDNYTFHKNEATDKPVQNQATTKKVSAKRRKK